MSVDMCTVVKEKMRFIEDFSEAILKLQTYSFLANMQKEFYHETKTNLCDGEVVVPETVQKIIHVSSMMRFSLIIEPIARQQFIPFLSIIKYSIHGQLLKRQLRVYYLTLVKLHYCCMKVVYDLTSTNHGYLLTASCKHSLWVN